MDAPEGIPGDDAERLQGNLRGAIEGGIAHISEDAFPFCKVP